MDDARDALPPHPLSPHALASLSVLPSTSAGSSSSSSNSPAHGDARPAKKRRADAAAPPPPHAPHAQFSLVQQHQHQHQHQHHQQGHLAGWYPAPPFELPIDPHGARRDNLDGLRALASPHPSPYTASIPFPSSLVAPSPFEQPVHWPAPVQQTQRDWTPNTPQSDAERTPSLLGADVTTGPSQLAWSHSLPSSPGAVEPITTDSSPYPWFAWMPTVPPPVTGSPDQYSVSPFTPLPSIPTPPSPPPFTTAVEPLPIAGFPLPLGNPSFPLPAGSPGYGHGVSGGPAGYQILTREAKDMVPFDRIMASEFHPPAAASFVADAVLEDHHTRPPLTRSRPSTDSAALPQASGLELGRTYPVTVNQLDDREWIKPEPPDRAVWDAPSFVPTQDQLLATHTELAETMPKVSRPSPETAALSQVSALTLRGPHPGAVKGLENSEWIKPEPLERLGWNEPGFVPVKAPLPLQPDAGEIESKPASEPDRENARDRKKRFRFDEERLRRETSNTRSMGACLRCHNQRVRCIPNKEDSTSRVAPCETCLKVRRDSKKTIHNIPCLRFKVTSMSIYRPGGLGLTREFTYTMVVDVPGSRDNLIYNIEMTQGLCRDPVRLCVRRFQPKDTDISYRRYMDDGRPKKQDAGAFCLADVERTAKEFNAYLERNALEGLEEAVKGSDDIVKDVFVMIAAHYKFLSDPVNPDPDTAKDSRKSPDQKEFLQKMIRLWFGIRHGLGKAWITSGGEALGTSPGAGPNHPLQGRMSVPRMIVAQFDSIRCERVYKTLAPEVLRGLDTFLTSCNKEAWFTVFLVTFLLLHQVAVISFDRWRYTRENCEGRRPDTRYGNISPQNPLTGWIEDVHLGAVTLLAHWHYFKRCDLMAVNWDETAGESALAGLTAPQRAFVRDVVERVRAKLPSIPATPAEGCWEHELFWVSRMFLSEPSREADWTPPEIFTRDKPSVGRE